MARFFFKLPKLSVVKAGRYKTLVVLALIILQTGINTPLSAAEKKVALDKNDVLITEDDMVHYIRGRFDDTNVEAGLQRPGAFARVVEDLYVLARIADDSRAEGLVEPELLAWIAEDSANREALKVFLEREVEKVIASVNWEEAAREYYLANLPDFTQPESVNVDHILIKTDGKSWDEFVAAVDEVASRLDDGADFNELALELSEDASAKTNGGRLGVIAPGSTVPEFEQAAWSMTEPGEVTGPVMTQFGAHFIRFNARIEASQAKFDSVKLNIIRDLRRKRGAAVREDIITRYRAELAGVGVDVDEAAIRQRLGLPVSNSQESSVSLSE